jgi:hypothetical protein
MKPSFKTIFVLGLPLFLTNCQQYKLNLFSSISQLDTLQIQVEMSECGEWGGHKEKIYIYRRLDNNLYATYQRDTVPCGKIVSKNGVGVLDDELRIITMDTTVRFTRTNEKQVKSFIKRIFKLTLMDQLPISNFGDNYQILKTDSTFIIEYLNWANKKNTHFQTLKHHLFGKI